ncbi:DUF6448 family protein [Pelotalea chapellei]|uniref:Uncharacterized protein n=1 Tax=Pelotalea chapellei TaxID=44671 RepID=A0ABS5UC18_9BACT|nr:hypothetical protein [Pelotalea chapellei]
MKAKSTCTKRLLIIIVAATMSLWTSYAAAHCDTLDGPVVQDARKALDGKDVTPVLKWVQPKDENSVKAAFNKALAAQGKKQQQAVENKFFESLVRVHRAGEGAPFTGLKPAGEVEPVIAEADKALTGGSPDGLIKMVTDTVKQGISQRYEKVAEALKHKDESIQKGREYVAAYVEYTHYVERLQMDAEGHAAHHGKPAHKKQATEKHVHGHK